MSKEPNRNLYVGHRYVPLLMGEWDNKQDYEGLSIVTHKGASYTSKKRVPVGIDILNEEFWVLTGNYNAQVEYYRDDVDRYRDEVTDMGEYVDSEISDNRQYVENNIVDFKSHSVSDMPNVKYKYGAIGDGVNDDTQALQDAINYSCENQKPILIPEGIYKTTDTLVFEGGAELYTLNAIILADHDKPAVHFKGGPVFNDQYGKMEVTRSNEFLTDETQPSEYPNAHGIIIESRCRFETIFSNGHPGNGFDIRGVTNLNKSTFKALFANRNSGYGFYFSGTQDNSSVWKINIYAQYNYKSGIYMTDDFMGRSWSGNFYSEENGLNGEDDQVYIGKLRNSVLDIYAESYGNTGDFDIVLGENTEGLTVRSARNNADFNYGTNNRLVFHGEGAILQAGEYGTGQNPGTEIKPFKSDRLNLLSNRPDRFVDYLTDTRNVSKVERIFGNGDNEELIFNKETDKGQIFIKSPEKNIEKNYNNVVYENVKYNGTITNPDDIVDGEIIHSQIFKGYKTSSDDIANVLKVEVVAPRSTNTRFSSEFNIYTKESDVNDFSEDPTFSINSSGDIELNKHGGGIVVYSPNGTRYKMGVNDSGDWTIY